MILECKKTLCFYKRKTGGVLRQEGEFEWKNLAEISENIIDFLYMAALPKVSDKHRKFMIDVFGTDCIEDIRQKDEKSDWNYVDEKIEPYLCGDDAEVKEIADDVEMFVHARYAVR